MTCDSAEGLLLKLNLPQYSGIHTLLSQCLNTFLTLTLYIVGIDSIELNISRPFFLHQSVQLIDILSADPCQRFVITGHGPEARVTIRIFRGDEPEIVEYVEQWRVLICAYLISKCDTIGSLHLPVGLSKIGAYVSRPMGMYVQCMIFCPFNYYALTPY